MHLIMFLCLLASTQALYFQDTVTSIGSRGSTICNYTYIYENDGYFVGPEEIISDAFECGDGSANCTTTLKFEKNFTTLYEGIDKLYPIILESLKSRVGQLVNKSGVNSEESVFEEGTHSCTIRPGYRVQIVTRPRYHKLTGRLAESCDDPCPHVDHALGWLVCTGHIRSFSLKIKIPVASNNDNQTDGSISCKVEPAANIEAMTRICNPKKMTSGKMFDAVGDALHKVMTNPRLNLGETIAYSTIHGYNVWAIGMCHPGLNHDSCNSCIRDLVDNIWSECSNAVGAQLVNNNCSIRYKTYELTLANSEDFSVFND